MSPYRPPANKSPVDCCFSTALFAYNCQQRGGGGGEEGGGCGGGEGGWWGGLKEAQSMTTLICVEWLKQDVKGFSSFLPRLVFVKSFHFSSRQTDKHPASHLFPCVEWRSLQEGKRFPLDTVVIRTINSGWKKAPRPLLLSFLERGSDYQRRGSVINARLALATWRRDGAAERERVDIERRALYRLICRLIHVLCSWASPISLQSRSERCTIERNVRIHHQPQSRPLMGKRGVRLKHSKKKNQMKIQITDTEAAKESVLIAVFTLQKKQVI